MSRLTGWLGERLDADGVQRLLQKKSVPVHSHTLWYYLGGMTLFLFLIQVATGILLMLYYRPSADEAFESVQFLMTTVPFGWLIRSIHSWSANLMIGLAFVHLFSVFFLRSYRKPRELTWMSGVVLLVLTLAFGFSGYLLPWNRLAYFATRVGTDVAGSVPFIGHWMLRFLRGGDYVTGGTLSRFYGWHVAILPALTTIFLTVHLFLVQKQGMSVPPSVERKKGLRLAMPFFPNFMLRDLVGWLVALACLAGLASLFPWELGEKADPFAPAFANIKPEWCFMFMFQTLKIVPGGEILGIETESWVVLAFGVAGVILLLVPFLDPARRPQEDSWIRHAIGWLAFAYILVMTAWGYHAFWLIPVAALALFGVFLQSRFAQRNLDRMRAPLAVLLLVLGQGLVALALMVALATGLSGTAAAQAGGGSGSSNSSCENCHRALGEDDDAQSDIMAHWEQDVHRRLDLGCVGCHGGNPDPGFSEDIERAMDPDKGYVGTPEREREAEFCGKCHSDLEYMRHYNPRARVDQVTEYRASTHGKANAAGDTQAASCSDCHGAHGILDVSHPNAPVHAHNVPRTCNRCHGDENLMSQYRLPTDPYEKDMTSVPAAALLERGDIGAPACNDCHGNHGAAPPGAESVANVCGQCHVQEATLFRDSFKKEIFDDMDQSECDVCHGHHDVPPPTLEMLNNEAGSVCMECHEVGDECYVQTGRMYAALKDVDTQMREATEILQAAARAGVEVSEALFHHRKEGISTLVKARTLIHSFDVERLLAESEEALTVAEESRQAGLLALREVGTRRTALWGFLALTVLAIAALLAWIRQVDRNHPLVVEDGSGGES